MLHEPSEYMDFALNVILYYHSMIYRYMPHDGGSWKVADNEIVEKHPDGFSKDSGLDQ